MDDDNITPLSVDDSDAPFAGPDPDMDDLVSTRPEADGEVDEQELYDAGLEAAAEMGDEDMDGDEDGLPDGFHIE